MLLVGNPGVLDRNESGDVPEQARVCMCLYFCIWTFFVIAWVKCVFFNLSLSFMHPLLSLLGHFIYIICTSRQFTSFFFVNFLFNVAPTGRVGTVKLGIIDSDNLPKWLDNKYYSNLQAIIYQDFFFSFFLW